MCVKQRYFSIVFILLFLMGCSDDIGKNNGIVGPLDTWSYESDSFVSVTPCLIAEFRTAGYFEGTPCDDDQINTPSQYYLPPEYAPTMAVIMSENLGLQGEDILTSTLEAKSDVWFLSQSNDAFYSAQTYFQDLPQDLSSASEGEMHYLNVRTDTYWARDWSPLVALPEPTNPDKTLKLIDANYYSDRGSDDSVPRQIRDFFASNDTILKEDSVKRVSLPVYMEGGNIMCIRHHCFLSNQVIFQNIKKAEAHEFSMDADKIKNAFNQQISQKIWFIEQMPHEGTKHIDMWAKFLNENLLLINQISDEALKTAPKSLQKRYKEIQAFLEVQASGVDSEGNPVENSLGSIVKEISPEIKIVRVPMPIPGFYGSEEIFRSYNNSLLVNNVAIIPRFSTVRGRGEPYSDGAFMDGYETTVENIYTKAGYQIKWVDSDEFISYGGAIHCTTMQVPAFDAIKK